MNKCKKYKSLIGKMILGNIDGTEMSILKTHCAHCADCNTLFLAHTELSKSNDPIDLPGAPEFSNIRQNVLRQIRLNQAVKHHTIFDRLAVLIKQPAFSYGIALGGLIAGFILGSFLFTPENRPVALVDQIDYVAAQNTDLRQVENSPYTYSNISIDAAGGDKIHLSFNVSTHIDLVRSKSDPLVKEILAQSLINPEPTGYRLRNMGYAEKIMDPKIKEALIFSLKNDPALPVRLKALANLMQYKKDDVIQSALLTIIRDEESVQMRLLAMDYLTENRIDASVLNQAVQASSLDIKTPVLVRAQQYSNTANPY